MLEPQPPRSGLVVSVEVRPPPRRPQLASSNSARCRLVDPPDTSCLESTVTGAGDGDQLRTASATTSAGSRKVVDHDDAREQRPDRTGQGSRGGDDVSRRTSPHVGKRVAPFSTAPTESASAGRTMRGGRRSLGRRPLHVRAGRHVPDLASFNVLHRRAPRWQGPPTATASAAVRRVPPPTAASKPTDAPRPPRPLTPISPGSSVGAPRAGHRHRPSRRRKSRSRVASMRALSADSLPLGVVRPPRATLASRSSTSSSVEPPHLRTPSRAHCSPASRPAMRVSRAVKS